MNNTIVLNILKQELKNRHILYKDLASHLSISEPTIKRMFSSKEISLDRLLQILEFIEMDFQDLQKKIDDSVEHLSQLTEAQEKSILKDHKTLLVTTCVLNHSSFKDILAEYDLTEPELIRILLDLEKINFLKLMPNNQIKLMIHKNFQWITNGPIEQFFNSNIQQDFLKDSTYRKFSFGYLTEQDFAQLRNQINFLIIDFMDKHETSKNLSINLRKNYALLIDFKQWTPQFIKELRK